MSTLGTTALTLTDWMKRIDPDGQIRESAFADLLFEENEILEDMLLKEGNLPTGHQGTIITGYPSSTWRKFNYGVAQSKGQTVQVTDTCGMLEQYGEVDEDLAALNGNTNEFMLSENRMHISSINKDLATALFYSDTDADPEKILGFAPRYYDVLSSTNYGTNNVINMGGTGSDLASMWLICWGENTIHGIFPKGSKAGLRVDNLGIETKTLADGSMLRVHRMHYQWKIGLHVKNWKYAVRIANIESAISATGSTTNGLAAANLMLWAKNKIPNLKGVRPVFYCNGDIKTQFDILAMNKTNCFYTKDDPFGQPVTYFFGIPIKRCDALLSTESALA